MCSNQTVSVLATIAVVLTLSAGESVADDDGTEFFVFEGETHEIASNYTNPYSGLSLPISGTFLQNNSLYFGTDCFTFLFMTNLADALFIENELGELVISSIEEIVAGDGDDLILLASTTHVLGDTLYRVGEGNDIVWANAGNDTLEGSGGDDILDGGPGDDYIDGDTGNNWLSGGAGNDYIRTSSGGINHIFGGAGNDQIFGPTGTHSLYFTDNDGIDAVLATETASVEIVFADHIRPIDVIVCPTLSDLWDSILFEGFSITFRNGDGLIFVVADSLASGELEEYDLRFGGGEVLDIETFPSPSDLDANGAVNVDDIDLFVTGFIGGDLGVDYDNNGLLNVDDIDAFVQAFLAGCP